MPNMVRVISGDLFSVGYKVNNLYIKFNSGATYIFYNVPHYLFEGLLGAPSKGKYFHSNIKDRYRFSRI